MYIPKNLQIVTSQLTTKEQKKFYKLLKKHDWKASKLTKKLLCVGLQHAKELINEEE